MSDAAKVEFISLFDTFDEEPNGKKVRIIKDELAEMKGSLKVKMDSGLVPDEMKTAAMLYLATQTAIYLVDSL